MLKLVARGKVSQVALKLYVLCLVSSGAALLWCGVGVASAAASAASFIGPFLPTLASSLSVFNDVLV